jgi:hypothetical protein
MNPGDLVRLTSGAGYGIAYHPFRPLRKGEMPRGSVTIPDGTVLMYVEYDDAGTDVRMQPMAHVMFQGTLLTIDERFLALVPPSDGMV